MQAATDSVARRAFVVAALLKGAKSPRRA